MNFDAIATFAILFLTFAPRIKTKIPAADFSTIPSGGNTHSGGLGTSTYPIIASLISMAIVPLVFGF
ncbi:MAG TPA: hypothetical protein DHV36_18525 [Desulfobacteraceae bacterium]|nr:hypothetical protein [Desulfobacteraceae bacterium]|tara:strand:+ start:461 stop:661 length:201 start_codon:yes stop_codon:yes gene_type:complete